MKREKIVKLLVMALLIGCVALNPLFAAGQKDGGHDKSNPEFFSIVGATSGGVFFYIANGMAQLLNDKMPGMKASAQSTAGTPKIFETLHQGNGEIGFGQMSIAEDAYNGTGRFKDNKMDKLRGMTFVYPNVSHFIVRKDSGIKKPEDMKGKRIAVGERGGGVEVNARQMFEAIGLKFPDDVSPEYTTGGQSADLLRNNQIVGAYVPAALGYAVLVDLMSSGDFELMAFPMDMIQKFQKGINKAFFPFTIPANTYPNQPAPVQAYAEANWLFARSDLSEKLVFDILTVLYQNQPYLVNLHAVSKSMTLENSQSGKLIPLHPGAVKFFKERGVDVGN